MIRFSSRRAVPPGKGQRSVLRLLVLAGLACAALTAAVMSAHAATPSTDYGVVGVDSPDSQPFARFPERLIDTGDLTGDGVRDVFASSYLIDVNGVRDAGKVVLINGATQKIVYEVKSPDPQQAAQFGFYISVPGDLTGDGKDELVVGEPYRDVGPNENQGRAYVYNGATNDLLYSLDNPNPQPDEGIFATFGARIGAAGDVTGDGVGDILIGSPANDVPTFCGFTPAATPEGCRKNEGEVFLFNGATGALVRTIRIPEGDEQPAKCSTTASQPEFARCGNLSVAQSPGDLDRDGVPDYTAAAYSLKRPFDNPEFFGRVYLFSGASGRFLAKIDQPVPDGNAFWGLNDLAPNSPGDVTGDGVPDLYAEGFLQDGPNGEPSAGRGWVFDGARTVATGEGVVAFEPRDPSPTPSEAFGFTMSRTDYNKDGRPDLYLSGLSGQNTETYVFDGRDGSLLKTLALPPSEAQASVPGNSGSGLGWSSRAPGDLNGDGEPDYVASAPFQDVGGTQDQGKVFFFLSNVPAQQPPGPPPPGPQPPGPQPPAGPCVVPGAAGYQFPAKMRLSRARVLRQGRRLDVVAPITSRAEGDVAVTFFADGRRDKFDGDVTQTNGPLDVIRINKKITRGQAQLGTGIVLIDYQGDGDTRGQFVRLRAASQRAGLDVERISLQGDRFSARGSVTRRARGVVRFRYSYLDSLGREKVFTARAKIQGDGDWNLKNAQVPTQLARCGGYLSVQFTGYFPRRIRGEQLGYELNAGQTRTP